MAPLDHLTVAAESSDPAVVYEFLALAAFVSGMVTLVDPDGSCRWASPSVDDVLGSRPQARVGQAWFELLHADDVVAARAQLAELVATGDADGRLQPYRLRRAGGDYTWVEPHFAMLRDAPSNNEHRMVLVEREVDELVKAEERTRAAQNEHRHRFEELEQVNHELERFAAVVAHDLAAPLLVVSNYATMLVGGTLTPEQADYTARIRRTVDRMQQLIQDLRRFSLADAALELGDVSVGEVLEEVRDTLAPLIDKRQAQISTLDEMPTVTGDRGQVTQLLQNLISNAIKFGPPLDGDVRIAAARTSGAWRISVTDGGSGIALEDRQRIFEPFRRLRGTGHIAGTGLGLTICQRIVQNHRGQLTLDSLPGLGSTFSFTLPDREPSPSPA
jgi:PAS domain S-box-containing protein